MTEVTSAPFSFRIDSATRARLKEEARRNDRSESYIAVRAIKEYLAQQEHKRAMIDDAVERSDQGRFISAEAMAAWVDSWGSDAELPRPEVDTHTT